MFQGNWTWAKGIDDVGTNVQSALLDVENLGRDRADSDYVRRHVLKFNGSWDVPFAPRGAWTQLLRRLAAQRHLAVHDGHVFHAGVHLHRRAEQQPAGRGRGRAGQSPARRAHARALVQPGGVSRGPGRGSRPRASRASATRDAISWWARG